MLANIFFLVRLKRQRTYINMNLAIKFKLANIFDMRIEHLNLSIA